MRRAAVGRRMVFPSRFSRCYHIVAGKFSRPARCSDGRFALVYGCLKLAVAHCRLSVPILRGYWRHMRSPRHCFLLRRGPLRSSTRPAVIGDPIHCFVNHRFVVHVVDVNYIYVRDGTVVEKVSPVPTSAHKANAKVAEAVIDSTVEADLRTPEAVMK